MPDRHAGLRGRLPVKAPADRYAIKYVHEYAAAALPQPTYPLDVSDGITQWGMDGNGPDPTLTVNNGQPVGDCAVAAYEHQLLLSITLGKLSVAPPTSNGTVDLYFQFTGGKDTGCNLGDLLVWLFNNKHIAAFAPVDLSQIDVIMGAFGRPIILGVDLTDDAEKLFESGEAWTTAHGERPDPSEGHAILKVKSDASGGDGTVVTWGALQDATGGWFGVAPQEAWVILLPEDESIIGAQGWAALVSDIQAAGGRYAGPTASAAPS